MNKALKLRYFIGFLVVSVLLIGFTYSYSQDITVSKEAKDYFLELAFGVDYGDKSDNIKKWNQDIKIYPIYDDVKPGMSSALSYELGKVLKDLNPITNNIKLHLVSSIDEANLIVFLGSGEEYASRIEPNAKDYVKDNAGLFWCYWNENYEIVKASMYVDTTKIEHNSRAQHILRENLTQSLGFLRKSDKYPKSIFYKGLSTISLYQPIDRMVIQILYHNKIKLGMTRDEVIEVLKEL